MKIEPCFDEQLAVNQATVALKAAKDQLESLRTQFGQAGSTAEREAIMLDIAEVEEQIEALEAQLAAAKQALDNCLDVTDPVLDGRS